MLRSANFVRLSVLAVLLIVCHAASAATPIKVFLLGGQSNMNGAGVVNELSAAAQQPQSNVLVAELAQIKTLQPTANSTFGPEIGFGQTVGDGQPTEKFAIIKYARGGTSLYADWNPTTGSVYSDFRTAVSGALTKLISSGYEPQIVGMLWTQGERDANDLRTTQQYTNDLNGFIADIRSRYGADLPFFLSRLSLNQTSITSTRLSTIRAAQDAVAALDPNAYLINTDSMTVGSDNLHFNTAGQMALGQAFGTAYLSTVTVPEPASLAVLGLGSILLLRRRRQA